jgi:SAM-dependent methyltransferase
VLPLRRGQRVLDLGCGEGRHVIAAAACDGVDAVGVDLSREDLATARERMREFGDNVPGMFALLAGDALRLPFPDDCFDAVICSEVLEHIPDYRAAVGEVYRVLKPGGRLCVSVPRPWCERLCWLLSRDYHQVRGGHLRIFSADRPARGDRRVRFCYLLPPRCPCAAHTLLVAAVPVLVAARAQLAGASISSPAGLGYDAFSRHYPGAGKRAESHSGQECGHVFQEGRQGSGLGSPRLSGPYFTTGLFPREFLAPTIAAIRAVQLRQRRNTLVTG